MQGMDMNQGFWQANAPVLIATGIALICILIWWKLRDRDN